MHKNPLQHAHKSNYIKQSTGGHTCNKFILFLFLKKIQEATSQTRPSYPVFIKTLKQKLKKDTSLPKITQRIKFETNWEGIFSCDISSLGDNVRRLVCLSVRRSVHNKFKSYIYNNSNNLKKKIYMTPENRSKSGKFPDCLTSNPSLDF